MCSFSMEARLQSCRFASPPLINPQSAAGGQIDRKAVRIFYSSVRKPLHDGIKVYCAQQLGAMVLKLHMVYLMVPLTEPGLLLISSVPNRTGSEPTPEVANDEPETTRFNGRYAVFARWPPCPGRWWHSTRASGFAIRHTGPGRDLAPGDPARECRRDMAIRSRRLVRCVELDAEPARQRRGHQDRQRRERHCRQFQCLLSPHIPRHPGRDRQPRYRRQDQPNHRPAIRHRHTDAQRRRPVGRRRPTSRGHQCALDDRPWQFQR